MNKSRISLVAFMIFVCQALTPSASHAALVTELSTANNCTTSWGLSGDTWGGPAIRVYAPYAVEISGATIPFGSNIKSGTISIKIYNDNASSPSTALAGVLTQSSFDVPTLTSTLTGSIAIPSAGYYWVQMSHAIGTGDYNCYKSSVDYVGSAPGWIVYTGMKYGSAGSGYVATAWTNFSSPSYNYVLGFTLFSSGPPSATIAAPISSERNKVAVLTASTSGNSGTVTFYAQNKRIANCIAVPVISSSATCNWKPTVRGSINVFAIYSSSPGRSGKTTSSTVSVVQRSGLR